MNIKKITAIFASAVLVSGFSVGNCFASAEIQTADAAEPKIVDSYLNYGNGEFRYDIYSDNHIKICKGDKSETISELTIPSEINGIPVTEIDWYTFSENKNLTKVKLPDKLVKIGSGAFQECTALKSIIIPDSVQTIEDYAFMGDTALISAEISKNFANSGDAVFSKCIALETVEISDGATVIGEGMFRDCRSLTEVTVPDSVKTIGKYAFDGCGKIESINIPKTLSMINESTFKDCKSLKSVTIPETVKGVEYYAFKGCSLIESVNLPKSVLEIGIGAFSDCTNLKSITINNPSCNIGSLSNTICNAVVNYESKYNGLVVYGYRGSTAEKWVKYFDYEKGLSFSALDGLSGDVNNDNKVDSKDAVLILKSYAETLAGGKTDIDKSVADVNGDGSVDSKDAVIVLKYYAETLTGFSGGIEDYLKK